MIMRLIMERGGWGRGGDAVVKRSPEPVTMGTPRPGYMAACLPAPVAVPRSGSPLVSRNRAVTRHDTGGNYRNIGLQKLR